MVEVARKRFGLGALTTAFLLGVIAGLVAASQLPYAHPAAAPEGYVTILSDKEYFPKALELVQGAEKNIYVAMYVAKYDPEDPDDPVNDLLSVLASARQRGLDVRVLVDDETLESYPQTIGFLKSQGVLVRLDESHAIRMHAKLLIVDGKHVLVGSHNWTESALKYNHEATAYVRSQEVGSEATEYFMELWEEGRSL